MAGSESKLCLVTGGAGFIGSHLAERLVQEGYAVRILDNFSAGKESRIAGIRSKVDLIKGDICNLDEVRRAMKGVRYVFHQAAIRSVPKSIHDPVACNNANTTGTLHVLMAAREAKVKRVVYASSSSVYGNAKRFPQREQETPQPLSPYAATKLAGEHYAILFAKTYGLETVSLRYFNVFGPRQDPESMYSAVVPKFMEQVRRDLPLTVHWDGKQARDFTFVSNIVSANLLAAKAPAGAVGEAFNIGTGGSHSLLHVIRILAELRGKKLERHHEPMRSGDVRKTHASIAKARRLLGYKPAVGLKEGLRRTWEWFEKEWADEEAGRQMPEILSRAGGR